MSRKTVFILLPTVFFFFGCTNRKIDFNAEIRPILNDRCVNCHGGVKQSGGFGLVFRENALGLTDNEKYGIVPGSPSESEMFLRITHHDPEERMPYEEEALNKSEIALIKRWIKQGAEWNDHWAYLPPQKPEPPLPGATWPANGIDQFILANMQAHGLEPSPSADRKDLLRRLYLDVIGLPPAPEEIIAFEADTSLNAYEKRIDELLASPKFGEHWASLWLDLARYADSFGYSSDIDRVIWRYRDWVIQALNDDMPFDQFTIEQLAGDLLPDPTTDQLLATAFHRNAMTNGEGGADHEEYRIASVIDRVNTTWEIWQGTTMACVQCHSHPYDPIRHEEFYQAFAIFNNTADRNLREDYPLLKTLTTEDSLKVANLKDWVSAYEGGTSAEAWEKRILIGGPRITPHDFSDTVNVQHINRVGDDYMSVYDASQIKISGLKPAEIDKLYLHYKQDVDADAMISIHLDNPDKTEIGRRPLTKTNRFEMLPIDVKTTSPTGSLWIRFRSDADAYRGFLDGFLPVPAIPGEDEEGYADMLALVDDLMNAKPDYTTPVLIEKAPAFHRTTNVYERGNWLTPTQTVQAGVPEIFQIKKTNIDSRLDLARWLVSEDNPLTSRVMVNRIWARFYGRGIVETAEDFGALGDLPTHPDLLDHLAVSFSQDWNWRLKTLIKNIVMSSAYQQESAVTPQKQEIDPSNIWLSRFPRVRLTAEQIRDQALEVSGLLSSKMYGPSVMPRQPDGIWNVSFSNAQWKQSEGEDQYRRAIYTYLKRTAPYPSFLTFDATDRQVCVSRRINTNTPLQALVTLNDPVFIEAAQALAQQVVAQGLDDATTLQTAYVMVMGKEPTDAQEKVLHTLFEETMAHYQNMPQEADALSRTDLEEKDAIRYAVYTVVANTLMNMDEFIVKS